MVMKANNLNKSDLESIKELKKEVLKEFPDSEIILYGSKSKGEDSEYSDIDILVLINESVTTKIEERIFGIAYDIELKNDVVFGIVVETKNFWESALSKAMPFHWNVEREGVAM
ncbi:MAG TPA: hypothetical protein DCP53_06035 [Elusimicrobia bacterium]|nr:MAG: hypothetical protein A2551_01125 [Elusimicrobia bacterium RIFOXYD2_FULL_34_30]HAM38932.1 hypothetical protein [Elusimicrobiota bacterium]